MGCPVVGLNVLSEAEYLKLDYTALEVAGPDAAGYLQGQLSQDVEDIPLGDCSMSLLLAPTGKITAICWVLREEAEKFVLLVESAAVDEVQQRLKRYLIRTKATVEVLDSFALLGRRIPPEAPYLGHFSGGYFGFNEVIYLSKVEPEGMVIGEREKRLIKALELQRIKSNFPSYTSELSLGIFPGALGESLEQFVSFQKGCYVGQELVERMHSRATAAPISLKVLTIEMGQNFTIAEVVSSGAPLELYRNGLIAGEVTSLAEGEPGNGNGIGAIKRSATDSNFFDLVLPGITDTDHPIGKAEIVD